MDSEGTGKTLELTDNDLGSVSGGKCYHVRGGKCYKYVGSNSDADWNASYLCPKCNQPLRYNGWGRYYCSRCDENWFDETRLSLNLESGVWQEIDSWDYR